MVTRKSLSLPTRLNARSPASSGRLRETQDQPSCRRGPARSREVSLPEKGSVFGFGHSMFELSGGGSGLEYAALRARSLVSVPFFSKRPGDSDSGNGAPVLAERDCSSGRERASFGQPEPTTDWPRCEMNELPIPRTNPFPSIIKGVPMIRRLVASVVAAAACAGCVHYGVETSQTSLNTVPANVTGTFSRNFPDAEIKSVWTHTFKAKIVSYEFEYSQESGQIKKVGVTPKGELVSYDNQSPSN
jgi:hypothetical protein